MTFEPSGAVARPSSSRPGLQAVLFDMDGTLLDSEHLWQIALHELAAELGGSVSWSLREALIGARTDQMVRIMHDDLTSDADPDQSARFLLERTAELFREGLVWRPGARELLTSVGNARVPVALVTSTERALVEIALDVLGRERFAVTVCGDEVAFPKPHPEPYLRAAELLGVDPAYCVAIEDSLTGTASAEAAGCAVLTVPVDLRISPAPRRTIRESLIGATVTELARMISSHPTASSPHPAAG